MKVVDVFRHLLENCAAADLDPPLGLVLTKDTISRLQDQMRVYGSVVDFTVGEGGEPVMKVLGVRVVPHENLASNRDRQLLDCLKVIHRMERQIQELLR